LTPVERLKEATTMMWALGDYSAVARLLEPAAAALADACEIQRGTRILDVATGSGNFALAAAQRGGVVTACDLTPRMLELARARGVAAGFDIEWLIDDAEHLSFPDGSFDLVASTFGAMFAPRPELVAGELIRVCRTGGLIAMANYSWEGFLGGMAKLFARYSTRLPFELPSPFEWGEPDVVKKRLGAARSVEVRPQKLTWTFATVDEALAFWEETNAPTIALKATVAAERYQEFRADARRMMQDLNESRDGRVELNSSYVSVLARR
jgi:ubiquinone/menaquinone biosynthesis C-methylase UbiE